MDMAGFAISGRELCMHGVINETHTHLAFAYTNRTGVLEVCQRILFF
jgi:hypothetical protein